MLISDKIEKILKDKIQSSLTENNIDGISFMLGWDDTQPIKGEEETSKGIITIKCSLPYFETPTITDGTFEVSINFVSRTDADYQGKNYLAVTENIFNTVMNWQKSHNEVTIDFSIENKFIPTGFKISQSDFGTERENGTWILSIQVIIYGIID